VSLAELTPKPPAQHGEVFTRRWVADLVLDLAGYTPDKDLGSQLLVEPSCGSGAFLVPTVERLVESARLHDRDLESLGSAIRSFDLLQANVDSSRKSVHQMLVEHGLSEQAATDLTTKWIVDDDFLLQPHHAATADYVVGNPPYVRIENIPRPVLAAYRRNCPTMRGRADIYVGFIERGLHLLKEGGALSFICADRWMRNQYGADLRELVTSEFAVDAVISMHDVDAFEDEVSAYPAIFVVRRHRQMGTTVVETNRKFDRSAARRLVAWIRRGASDGLDARSFEASRADRWFEGRDLWPAGSPAQLRLIADLESRFAPLQSADTGTRVGIGVATGCDDVFITSDKELVEEDRLLPLLQAPDTVSGAVAWSGRYLVDPWTGTGLVDLAAYPRLSGYLGANRRRLSARHIARRRPQAWYRTIDRVDHPLTRRAKLVVPDMKSAAHPVLEEGDYYPHHNLYYVVSDVWDLQVLGGILLSAVTNLFVGAYCVKMRGKTFRFQAQYLRRVRVPNPHSIPAPVKRALASAFVQRDHERATGVAAKLYNVDLGLSRSGSSVLS
jgi:adenine-specific DNA-methyltransferase